MKRRTVVVTVRRLLFAVGLNHPFQAARDFAVLPLSAATLRRGLVLPAEAAPGLEDFAMGRKLIKPVPLLFVLLIAMSRASAQAAPLIETITPASAARGTKVTIAGRGFAADNTVLFGKTRIVHVKIVSAVAIACTTNPNCRPGIRRMLEFPVPKSEPGRVKVSVTNVNGSSNAVDFDVLK